jgi:hypothetical protein
MTQNNICKCFYCGEDFKVSPSVMKNGGKKFCSIKCSRLFKSILKCLQCGKEFRAERSAKRKFCSLSCFYEYTREHPNKVKHENNRKCLCCEKEFYLTGLRGQEDPRAKVKRPETPSPFRVGMNWPLKGLLSCASILSEKYKYH